MHLLIQELLLLIFQMTFISINMIKLVIINIFFKKIIRATIAYFDEIC